MNFSVHYLPFFMIIIFTLIIQLHKFVEAGEYDECKKPFLCGKTNMSYPFYNEEKGRPMYCGHPGFGVSCEDNNLWPEISVMTSSSEKFYLVDMNLASDIISVSPEVLLSKDLCPEPQDLYDTFDTTLNLSTYSYIPTAENVTLYYECSFPSSQFSSYKNQILCGLDSGSPNAFFMTPNLKSQPGFHEIPPDKCKMNVSIPVSKSLIDGIKDRKTLWNAFQTGFELKWIAENKKCADCRKSNGVCGYDATSFTCYCPDGHHGLTCYVKSLAKSKSNNAKGMVIGLVVGGIVLAAVALVCLIFFVRRKRRSVAKAQSKAIVSSYPSNGNPSSNEFRSSQEYTTSPSTYLSPSIPSYPSSKSDFENSANYLGVPLFSYDELEEATENFHERRELGDGGFGTVYYGNLNDGRLVAVKRLYENSCRHMGQFMNEIRILATLRHKNLVTLYGCTSRRSRELLLVYEYVSNGTVADHLHGKRAQPFGLPWSTRLSIAVETADALSFLHEKNVIHRDVKTTNILLEKTFQVKVADFGLSRLFPNDVTHVSTAPQGTPGYVDPEYYQCYQLTEKSDVYSFGVVLAELISSKMAVDITRHRHDINLANMVVDRIQKHALHELIDPKLDVENDGLAHKMVKLVAEVAFQCLQQDKDARPSMKEVLGSLKAIQKQMQNAQKQVVVDINECDDDAGLLKNAPPPLSPETQVSNNSLR
ncbi:LEAF RUST 10 DISEASE-RESISTANCE LOCUS RECEPTOR-LIKE PROTEIN KINASE-like 1.4 isoform X2 [Amaranthus tricolor]|uniref:LEAF RUST 10 DISEASE-RESISTANCE LOCUS RECEPTOR-LIKE PROTEIN KINASE-like 1.4 isoform X2 n=1 Tax=Amaranthus tricolor TaxID=29722 RepID=UPI00258D86DB|nr:LEAF RUST 10 DISEASE-RESISTANCE LOCUS RECEPTOR-LIKE PROTEIN KINASE-like 1.4 isoform X2 [Amaranthus tricolor]